MYPGGVLWVYCGEAATPWWVLRQVWALVQRVRLGTTKYAVPWLVNVAQYVSKPLCPVLHTIPSALIVVSGLNINFVACNLSDVCMRACLVYLLWNRFV